MFGLYVLHKHEDLLRIAAQSAEDGSHCFSVFQTDEGEILPCNYIGIEVPDATKQKYPDYQLMGVVSHTKACLVQMDGVVTGSGHLIAKELGMRPDAIDFRTFALDNMFCKINRLPQIKTKTKTFLAHTNDLS